MGGTYGPHAGGESRGVKFLSENLNSSHWIYVTQGRLQWRAAVDTVLNLLVP
jgi:hypothetical protein